MNVLQHTRNERNPCLKENRPDRSYRDTLLISLVNNFTLFYDKSDNNNSLNLSQKHISIEI